MTRLEKGTLQPIRYVSSPKYETCVWINRGDLDDAAPAEHQQTKWAKLTGRIKSACTTDNCCCCSSTFPPCSVSCRSCTPAANACLVYLASLSLGRPAGDFSSTWWTQHQKQSRLERKENVITLLCFDTFWICAFTNAVTFLMKHYPKCWTASGQHAELVQKGEQKFSFPFHKTFYRSRLSIK